MGFSKQLMSLNFFSDNDTLRGLIWIEVKVIFDSSPSEFHVKFNNLPGGRVLEQGIQVIMQL